jgi:hypothetical protein
MMITIRIIIKTSTTRHQPRTQTNKQTNQPTNQQTLTNKKNQQDEEGTIIIIDEVHTPDSSRYWVKETYEARQAQVRGGCPACV